GHRAVVIQDRKQDRLKQDGLPERPLHYEDRRAREVHVSLCISPDVPAETVGCEITKRRLVDHARLAEELDLSWPEAKLLDLVEQSPGAGHDAVPAAMRQVPGEYLEHRPTAGRTAV